MLILCRAVRPKPLAVSLHRRQRSDEPRRVAIGILTQIPFDELQREPTPVSNLSPVRRRLAVVAPDKDVQEFPFGQIAGRIVGIVRKRCNLTQLRLKPKLFAESPHSRIRRRLPRARMPAAGVRPEAAEVILGGCTPLKKQLIETIEDEYRERAMQQAAILMRPEFFLRPQFFIAFVDDYDLFQDGAPSVPDRS